MIAYIAGKITHKTPTCVHLDIGGLGYEVQISLHTYGQIQHMETCKLLTHLHIKEDAHTLYGFYSQDEKDLFLALLSVSGVGAATTRVILSGMQPAELRRAIVEEDEKVLQSLKGIGAKTAKRIILELKDKLSKTIVGVSPASAPVAGAGNSLSADALNALLALGIARAAADKAVQKALQSDKGKLSLENLIKEALKNL